MAVKYIPIKCVMSLISSINILLNEVQLSVSHARESTSECHLQLLDLSWKLFFKRVKFIKN